MSEADLYNEAIIMRYINEQWEDASHEYERPYSYEEMEQAFWHLWTLNCYHITLSFDENMVLLLDWALSYHMEMSDD